MKKTTINIINITVLFLSVVLSITSFSENALQQVGALRNSTIKVKLIVEDRDEQQFEIVAVEKFSAQSKNIILKADGPWYQGKFSANISDTKIDFQILEFYLKYNQKKLFVFIEKTTNNNENIYTLFRSIDEFSQYANDAEKKSIQENTLEIDRRFQNQKIRMTYEAMETQKRELRFNYINKLNPADLEKNNSASLEIVTTGDKLYREEQYSGAFEKYNNAIELNPAQQVFYFKAAVCLYKIGDYNQSLAFLSIAEGGSQNSTEHKYYVALNKMKIGELDESVEEFSDVQSDNNPEISPTAAFLAGSILYKKNKLPAAKSNFEYVLDHSKNPEMDKEAEKKIEEILRIQNYIDSPKDFFRYNLNAGVNYDGNVLNSASNNIATQVAAYRTLYSANTWAGYSPTADSEIGLGLNYSDYYSVDTSFKANQTLQTADPLVVGVSLPYKHLLTTGQTDHSYELIPFYTTITMAAETSIRTEALETIGLMFNYSKPTTAILKSIYKLTFEQDNSFLSSSTGDDNKNAFRTTLATTQITNIEDQVNTSFIADFAYTANAAIGKYNSYNKGWLGLAYTWPMIGKYFGVTRVDIANLSYPDSASSATLRNDKTVALSFGMSANLNQKWSFNSLIQYANNTSTVSMYTYDKFVITGMLTYTGKFQKK
jgi:hypothetical protein